MHRKHLLAPSLLACAMLLSAGHALAGTDLSVNGHIRPGSACSLTLGKGGTVDLGTISSKDLQETGLTTFDKHEISLSIQCQAPTKIAFRVLDNRAGTAFQGFGFGLGASGGKKIGRYLLLPKDRIGDGTALSHLVRWGNGSWNGAGSEMYTWKVSPSMTSSWSKPGYNLPQAFQNISSRLGFEIDIAPASNLDVSQEIAIDGSATVELVYL
ncbi:DUF1120 domain-containing protein [Burkholderia cepacia]|uniref:DUF1120 domain-containing protein n=1 Tax=Burkholderia cepacia GG4 TaxID=1009846 RepID=A0A9W3PAZ6_BURCE|nr:DUF1120 domain-containing protein [Burkholderia cepacia]AFQ50025.1 hypothetical protein GEM_3635 [Burkholderia cepacia GG4]